MCEQIATVLEGMSVLPVEVMSVSRDLDGSLGTNREWDVPRQIGANTNVAAVLAWLANLTHKKTTFNAYRKEAEQLLLCCMLQRGKPLSSLAREDWLAYQTFLSNPLPRNLWVSKQSRRHPRAHPRWRHFAGLLYASSQRQASIILASMFSWLVSAGYLAGNPLSLSRQRGRIRAPRIERYLDEELWLEVKATIDAMPRETPRERERYLRSKWLLTLLYVCGLRISEIAENNMGNFFCRRDWNGAERWWLEVVGKGSKVRLVRSTSQLMVELGRYRRERNYPPLPVSDGIHEIIKAVFATAVERIKLKGPHFAHVADRIGQTSAHWLRYTAGSHMANNFVDLQHARKNLGHVSISTTSGYLHALDDTRHDDTQDEHRANW